MKQRDVLTVFLGSPSDLEDERKKAKDVVQRINQHLAKNLGIVVELRGWEDTLPGYSTRSQELINAEVENCDLFLGILFKRWGTSTALFSSGFEEEFDIAYRRMKQGNLRNIWLFFRVIPDDILQDPSEQTKRVISFRERIEREREILYKPYSSTADWGETFYDMLSDYLSKVHTTSSANPTATPVEMKSTDQPRGKGDTSEAAYDELKEVVDHLAEHLDHGFDELSSKDRSRLFLVSSTLYYEELLPSAILGTHEIQNLYSQKEHIVPAQLETYLIIRTVIADGYGTSAGWYWYGNLNGDIRQILKNMASEDGNKSVRLGAMKYLKEILSPNKEMVTMIVGRLDDSSQDIRAVACELLGRHGDESHLQMLRSSNLLATEDDAKASWTAQFAILLRTDPQKAIDLLLLSPKARRGDYRQYLAQLRTLPQDTLESLLQHEDEEVRLDAVHILGEKLSEPKLNALRNDSSPMVQTAALVHLLRRDVLIGIDEVSRVADQISKLKVGGWLFSRLAREYSYDQLFREYFRHCDDKTLSFHIEWYSVNGPIAYSVKAERDYASFAHELRQDIGTDFMVLKLTSLELNRKRYPQIFGSPGSSKSPTLDLSVQDEVMLELFLRSALSVLAENAERDDINIARAVAAKELKHYKSDIWASVVIIIEKFGDAEDVELLLRIANEYDHETNKKERALRIAMKLSEDRNKTALTILEGNDKASVKSVLGFSRDNGGIILMETVQNLLFNEEESIRLLAVSYISAMLSHEELKSVLDDYVSKPTYYYNVVNRLDRILFAPEELRMDFWQEIRTLLDAK